MWKKFLVAPPILAAITLFSVQSALAQYTIDGGTIENVPSDHTSPWNVGGALTIGLDGDGTLNIGSGGSVQSTQTKIGSNGSTGTVTVNNGGVWNLTGMLMLGDTGGTGNLEVAGGTVKNTSYIIMSSTLGTSSSVKVNNGGGLTLSNSSMSYFGVSGTTDIKIENGGILSSFGARVSENATGVTNILVDGSGSRWNLGVGIGLGVNGQANMIISNGAVVSSSNTNAATVLGELSATAVGNATVDGMGSQWSTGSLVVGGHGRGTLNIINGGAVISKSAAIGRSLYGVVTVSGANSRWDIFGDLAVGSTSGTNVVGLLDISGGAAVTVGGNTIINTGSNNLLTVRGTGSTLTVSSSLNVGYGNGNAVEGVMEISDGGYVSSLAGNIGSSVPFSPNGAGVVRVHDVGSLWTVLGTLNVGAYDTGTLQISKGGIVSATDINVAIQAARSGTIIIGAIAGETPVAPGVLNTTTLTFGAGDGLIAFNHSDNSGSYNFTPLITGSGKIEVHNGTTTLMANNTYSGDTKIYGGTLKGGAANVLSSNSDYSVSASGTLDLAGYDQIIPSLLNDGTVSLAGNSAGTNLTITGNYTTNNGLIHLKTVLNNDASATDRLIIQGDASGSGSIKITNAGGLGAQTVADGIQIVEVTGLSGASFGLLGDYITSSGQPAVVAGAYAYTLWQNGMTNPTDGNWYLRSEMIDTGGGGTLNLYQPIIPLAESYSNSLLYAMEMDTLRQRLGATYNTFLSPASTALELEVSPVWIRVQGNHNRWKPGKSLTGTENSGNQWLMQAGVGVQLLADDNQELLMNLGVHYGYQDYGVSSIYGTGKINTNQYGLDASLTWFSASGYYLDTQARLSWFDSDLKSDQLGYHAEGEKATGYALSVELGREFTLNQNWSLIPQTQLVYSSIHSDSFHDRFNAHVSSNTEKKIIGRVGMSVDYVNHHPGENNIRLYGIGNLLYSFNNSTTSINVSDVHVWQKRDRLEGEVGLGGIFALRDGRYSVHAQGSYRASLENRRNADGFSGEVGFKIQW